MIVIRFGRLFFITEVRVSVKISGIPLDSLDDYQLQWLVLRHFIEKIYLVEEINVQLKNEH